MTKYKQSVSLTIQADKQWIAVAQGVVENGAPMLGLPQKRVLRLVIAVEELLAYLAQVTPGSEVKLDLVQGGAFVGVQFQVESQHTDLKAFNITSAEDISPESGMDNMGLLLASRMVDGFTLRQKGDQLVLFLRQEKEYPEIVSVARQRIKIQGQLSSRLNPEAAEIIEACELALALYSADVVHPCFSTPGKVVDMVAVGDLSMVAVNDQTGKIVGALFWKTPSEKSAGFYGPYVFAEERENVAKDLTNLLIKSVARTPVLGIFSYLATEDLPTGQFELLADTQNILLSQGKQSSVWYRHLREDMGMVVWSHKSVAPFLEYAYERLVLMRDIHLTQEQGEQKQEHSVFAAELQPELETAVLTPMLAGEDTSENIQRHVEQLRTEGLINIFFQLDLASGWQGSMAGPLLENEFRPLLVLPFAGQSDILVLQHVPVT